MKIDVSYLLLKMTVELLCDCRIQDEIVLLSSERNFYPALGSDLKVRHAAATAMIPIIAVADNQ